jgi:hypothetical protein
VKIKLVNAELGFLVWIKMAAIVQNEIYSAKIDNQAITFSNSNNGSHQIFIRK